MAVFQLGALVTEIAGSIGGTTFKRGNNYRSVQNKSNGGSRPKLLQNKRLNELRYLFSDWQRLLEVQRQQWNDVAKTVQFPDKFGVQRNITGRQLYIKSNAQWLVYDTIKRTPEGFTNVVDNWEIGGLGVDWDNKLLNLEIITASVNNIYLIQFDVNVSKTPPIIYDRKEIVIGIFQPVDNILQLGTVLFNKYSYLKTGHFVRIYVTAMNDSGMRSVTQTTSTSL